MLDCHAILQSGNTVFQEVRQGASPELLEILSNAHEFLSTTVADSTREIYSRDWRSFSRWCDYHELPSLPSNPEVVTCYFTSLAMRDFRITTIRRHSAAIASAHREAGYPVPTGHPAIKELLRGMTRRLGAPPKPVDALLSEDIKRIVAALPDTAGILSEAATAHRPVVPGSPNTSSPSRPATARSLRSSDTSVSAVSSKRTAQTPSIYRPASFRVPASANVEAGIHLMPNRRACSSPCSWPTPPARTIVRINGVASAVKVTPVFRARQILAACPVKDVAPQIPDVGLIGCGKCSMAKQQTDCTGNQGNDNAKIQQSVGSHFSLHTPFPRIQTVRTG